MVLGVLGATLLGRVVPGGFGISFLDLAGAWGTGLVFLLLGLAFLLFFRNTGSAAVVDHYCMALANQDYATAFQYLDLGRMTYQDDLDARTWFTRRAQAQDEQGTITDYALKGFRLQGGIAIYTIKFIRSNRSYTIPVTLSKRGDTWKIMGFDLF